MQEINPEIFSSNKWLLLKEIGSKPQSPTELAQRTSTSISNIIQQLKLLEAYSMVKHEKSKEKSSGKPKNIYSLNNEFVFAAVIRQGRVDKKFFQVEGISKIFFNLLFIVGPDDLFFILRFNIKHEDVLLKRCRGIGFLKSTKDTIELFLLTDHIDEIRAKFSNIFIEDPSGKTKKIINWTHNDLEIMDGLAKKDKYYMDMIKNIQIISDPQGILSKAKEKRELL